jgi:hypothetical protein
MKGTNPITQGHRWQKRVKERLKKHEHEEGQWERLEDKKSEEINARRAAEESAAAAEAEIDPGAEAIFAAADAGTDLRDEEGLDAEELAAVRAVKAAKAAAQARLQRVQREGEKSNGASDAPAKKRVKVQRASTSANPFAALVRSRPKPLETADTAPAPTATPPPPAPEPTPAPTEARKYRAGQAADIAKKRAIGVVGVKGGSQKKLKKLLKKKRAAGLA